MVFANYVLLKYPYGYVFGKLVHLAYWNNTRTCSREEESCWIEPMVVCSFKFSASTSPGLLKGGQNRSGFVGPVERDGQMGGKTASKR